MQDNSVPEAKEPSTEELAHKNREVLEHHEDEVVLSDYPMVEKLHTVGLDVDSGHLVHVIAD